jgi:ribosomal protein L23
MRQNDYVEGEQAKENFEEGMKALFKVPKEKVVKAERRQKQKRAARASGPRKQTASDRD